MSYDSTKSNLILSWNFFFSYWTYQTLQEASRPGDDDENLPH